MLQDSGGHRPADTLPAKGRHQDYVSRRVCSEDEDGRTLDIEEASHSDVARGREGLPLARYVPHAAEDSKDTVENTTVY